MAGTLRSTLHPQRSRLILSAWLARAPASGRSCGRRRLLPAGHTVATTFLRVDVARTGEGSSLVFSLHTSF